MSDNEMTATKVSPGGVLREFPKQSSERNYGIDTLRIYAMFLVVILHILGHGGVLKNATGVNGYLVNLLNVAAICAVDIYALISGYCCYTENPKPFKTAKFLTLWSQVFCYSFGITLCAFLIKPESIGIKSLIRSAFPVASDQYWFFSCYVALFILMPWLNRFIRSLENKDLTKSVAVLFGLFSLYMMFVGRLSGADPFRLEYGYSTIWLVVLYIIGAWMKRVDLVDRIPMKYACVTIISLVFISWLFKDIFAGFIQTGVFASYISPTIILIAMAYLLIFAKMNPGKWATKIITFFAPAAFGVYLIHDNNLIRAHFIEKYFGWIADSSMWLICIEVIGCALGILIGCLLIEKLRLVLFEKMKINRLIMIIGNKADGIIDMILNRICDLIVGG